MTRTRRRPRRRYRLVFRPAFNYRRRTPASRGSRRTGRGLARPLAGLVLVVVAAGCAGGDNPRGDAAPPATAATETPSPETVPDREQQQEREPVAVTPKPDAVATVEQSEEPLAPGENDSKALRGAYTLHIPRIDVTAPVVSIRSGEDRTLVPPRDPALVGWWSQGAQPGADVGSAIVVGHTVRAGGGVFDDIGELRVGDTVEVEGENSAMTYAVESVDVLSVEELAREAQDIFSQESLGRLVLVTCENWDGTAWTSNIIAIATPV